MCPCSLRIVRIANRQRGWTRPCFLLAEILSINNSLNVRATKWSAVQNAEMRCEDKIPASYVRVDGPTRHHDTLLLLPVSRCRRARARSSCYLSHCVRYPTQFPRRSPSPPSCLARRFTSVVRSRRCQYYVSRWGPWVPVLQGVITFFVLANFTLATFMDPGVIPRGMLTENED